MVRSWRPYRSKGLVGSYQQQDRVITWNYLTLCKYFIELCIDADGFTLEIFENVSCLIQTCCYLKSLSDIEG